MLKNVSPGLIENVKDLKVALNELTVHDLNVYSMSELYYKVAHKLNEVINELSRFEGVLSDEVIKQNEKLIYLLGEGLEIEVVKEIDNLIKKGFFEKIINQKIFRELNNKIDSFKTEIDSQLEHKASKNYVFSMANMGQDIKEAMTGGSVAVVGENTILRNNIVDGQVTFEKLDPIIKNEYQEYYIDEDLIANEGYISFTGEVSNDGGWKHYCCDCIPNYKYIISGQSWLKIPCFLFIDKDNKVISYFPTEQDKSTTNYSSIEIIAPTNASKIFINRYLSREFGLKRRSKITLKPLPIEKPPTKLTIIGDSLSADDSPQSLNKYHALLSQNDGYIVTNLAKGGHGYKRADDGDNSFWQQANKIPSDSDIVFIFGSFNDLGKVINGEYKIGESVDNASTSTDTIMECINKTITNIRAIKNDAIIVIASPTPWSNYHPGGGGNKDIAEKFVNAIETVAHNQNCVFLDLYRESNIWSWNGNWNSKYCPDGVHPNDLGHKRYLYPIIRDCLNKVNPNI